MNMFIFQIRIYCNNYSRLLQCQRHTNPDYKGSSLLIKHYLGKKSNCKNIIKTKKLI